MSFAQSFFLFFAQAALSVKETSGKLALIGIPDWNDIYACSNFYLHLVSEEFDSQFRMKAHTKFGLRLDGMMRVIFT